MRGFERIRVLSAVASAGLAVLSLAYADFGPMWRSPPAWAPWPGVWIHGLALIVLIASVGLCVLRTARPSALVVGAYYVIWAAIAAPQILPQPLSFGAWYGFVEALTCLTGASILYALLRWPSDEAPITARRGVRVARVLFGVTCVFYGASHFAYASYTATLVPAWLPGRLMLAYLTGAAHIAAGIALAIGFGARLAATLEAAMMSLFGLLVWVPSFWMQPRPSWATPPETQWSELVVTLAVAAAAWVVAASLRDRPWTVQRSSS